MSSNGNDAEGVDRANANTHTSNVSGTTNPNETSANSNQNSNNRRTNRGRSNNVITTAHPRDYTGEESDFGHILALKGEKLDKKVNFEIFREKLCTYIMKNLDDATDVIAIVKDLKDPRNDFEVNNLPKDLKDDEKKAMQKFEHSTKRWIKTWTEKRN